jgi:transposase
MQGRAVETLNDTPTVAGIDISKLKLDVAFGPDHEMGVFANDVAGCKALCKALAARKITRVGVEASGGYERWIVTAARAVGIEVIVFQPNQVKAYAVFLGQRAKTDPIDARLIAACTAHAIVRGKAPIDPHYAVLAEYLTLIEQIEEDLTRAKTRREAFHQPALRRKAEAEVKRLTLLRARGTVMNLVSGAG